MQSVTSGLKIPPLIWEYFLGHCHAPRMTLVGQVIDVEPLEMSPLGLGPSRKPRREICRWIGLEVLDERHDIRMHRFRLSSSGDGQLGQLGSRARMPCREFREGRPDRFGEEVLTHA